MKFLEIKSKISESKENIGNSIIIKILFAISVILGVILFIISIPMRIIIMIGSLLSSFIGTILILGTLLGFLFTPHISIFKMLWIFFCTGCLFLFPTVIIKVMEYVIELLFTWVLIFKK